MKKRVADSLAEMGFKGEGAEFRRVVAEVKAEKFPDWTDEQLIVTRDEAGEFCALVRKRLGAPRLTRPFILTALIGLRKNHPKAVATRQRI